jgi:hypothetical protein
MYGGVGPESRCLQLNSEGKYMVEQIFTIEQVLVTYP